jgi:thiamine-phosphate pyrophosphorylase
VSPAPAHPDGPPPRELPRLHLVTDDRVLSGADFLNVASGLLRAGGERVALHLRGPGMEGATLHRIAHRLAGTALDAGAHLFVNDRVDVALAVAAGGVHLGQRSLPPGTVRELVGPHRWIGVSTHDVAEACRAAEEGADYLFVGTLYSTPSHPAGRAAGPELIEAVRSAGVTLPIMGIGGVVPDRVEAIRAAGADGVAVIRGVWDAADPVAAVRRYLEVLEKDSR